MFHSCVVAVSQPDSPMRKWVIYTSRYATCAKSLTKSLSKIFSFYWAQATVPQKSLMVAVSIQLRTTYTMHATHANKQIQQRNVKCKKCMKATKKHQTNIKTSIHIRDAVQKKNGIFWEFFPKGGEGLFKSQNFCKFTKCFSLRFWTPKSAL